jgi:hypothetical protein
VTPPDEGSQLAWLEYEPTPEPELLPCAVCGSPTLRRAPGWGAIHALCEPRPTYSTGEATSHAADARANRRPGSPLAREVYRLLQLSPLTDDELCGFLPDQHPGSVSKRRADLVAARMVRDSGLRRRTRRGRGAIVWDAAR